MTIVLRDLCVWKAAVEDIPSIQAVHADSVLGLGAGYYKPEILEEWGKGFPGKTYRDSMNSGDTYFIASEHFASRNVIGFSSHAERDGRHYLDDLYVCKAAARQGLGTKLLGYVEHFARAQGATSLYLQASRPGEAFYRMLGFVELSRKEHLVIGDTPFMRKYL